MGRVRAGLEDEKFAAFDAVLHRLGETRRAHGVVAAKGDLRRRLDTRELSQCIMNLERIAGVVGGEKGNKDKRLAGPLLLIIYRDAIRFDLRHVNLPGVTCFDFFTAA